MTKLLAKSVAVRNSAADMESRLAWVLFKNEQERLLYGPSDCGWNSGDPLHSRPVYRANRDAGCDFPFDVEGAVIRPMIDIIDDLVLEEYMMCPDCDVSWNDETEPCWVCGKRALHKTKRKEYLWFY